VQGTHQRSCPIFIVNFSLNFLIYFNFNYFLNLQKSHGLFGFQNQRPKVAQVWLFKLSLQGKAQVHIGYTL